jgi:hypothetical protein
MQMSTINFLSYKHPNISPIIAQFLYYILCRGAATEACERPLPPGPGDL